MIGNHRVQLDHTSWLYAKHRSGAHLIVAEIPLTKHTALPQLSTEQPPQRGKTKLVPSLAARLRQQKPPIGFAPASAADRDEPEKRAGERHAKQLLGAVEACIVKASNVDRQGSDRVEQ